MASFSCSFAAHSQKNCDISKRYRGVKEFFPLTSRKKDIMSHLGTIKVGQTKLPTEKRFNSCWYWSFPRGWSQHDNRELAAGVFDSRTATGSKVSGLASIAHAQPFLR